MKKRLYILIVMLMAFGLLASIARAQNEQNLTDEQIYLQDIGRIEKYLNGITTLISSFTQETESGETGSGVFYLSRPGKLRWEHYPPNPIVIIAKGSILSYYDKELDQVSNISLDDSLATFLTQKHISFNQGDVEIIRFVKDKDKNEIAVTIVQKSQPDNGELTLIFGSNEIYLKRMQILDAVGKLTEVSFDTIVYDKPIGDDLFALPKR